MASRCLMMTATWVGDDLEEGERIIAPLRERVPPSLDLVGQFPYTFLQAASDPLAPHGRLNVAAMCGYLDELTEEVFDIAMPAAERFRTPLTVIEFSQMGGAVKRVPADATAVPPAFRDCGYFYIVGAQHLDASEVDACRDWTFERERQLEPYRLPGRYLNFVTGGRRGQHAGRARRRQLTRGCMEVKAKYDPEGVFSYNPNKRAAAVS